MRFAGARGLVPLVKVTWWVLLGGTDFLVLEGLLAPVVGSMAVVPGRGRAPVGREPSGVVREGIVSFRLRAPWGLGSARTLVLTRVPLARAALMAMLLGDSERWR